jgi:spermidine synthase
MDLRFALLLACFFLSGFAALLYQTAWTRELSFVFGTSELAVAAVLASYMGGLALGAAAAARFAPRLRRPVLAYGVLELAIAVSALLVPAAIRLINLLYVAWLGGRSDLAPAGAAATVFQLGAAFAVLLPPTAFMGATLPLLARHAVRREAEIGPRVGLLYAVNTAGAIAGTLCAAFWLMPGLGLRGTVWVGAVLNGCVFGLAARLARGAAPPPEPGPARLQPAPAGAGWILPAIAVSGAVSFAYEVLWARLLGHLIGSSVQAFATMLASFLLGIALGSAAAARLARSRERAAVGFGAAQLGIALAAWAALALADRLPWLARQLGAGPHAALASAVVAALPLLPITLCIGATFPFAVRLLAPHPDQAAAATARAYAWNTVGAIAGALGAGFALLPGLGFSGTVAAGAAVSLALAALAGLAGRPRRLALVAAAGAAGVALLVFPPRSPWLLLSTSPMAGEALRGEIVFSAVGRSSTVMLFEAPGHFRLTSNGLPESSILPRGGLPEVAVARWLGILPSLLRPGTRDLLVVGLGGGMALEIVPATVETIDVIELEPEVLRANQRIAAERAIDPLADPRVRVTLADARGALQLTARRWDAIVSQPSHPWTAGASHLYTREFFELARSRLAPEGVFVQWIGLAFVDAPLLRSLLATLREVFPYVETYRPEAGGLLFAASDAPLGLAGAPEALRGAPADYARLGLHRLEDIAAARVLDDAGTRALAEGAQRNTDDHNLLAARAAQLGKAALDAESTHALMQDLDPLATGRGGLDLAVLIRALVERGFRERADALAHSQAGAEEELALGWIELSVGRKTRASRHFSRALELDPAARDAGAGLVACWLSVLGGGAPVPALEGVALPSEVEAVVEGYRHARARDWNAVAALDAQLARIRPGEALFEEASRLRIQWRLAAEDGERAAEALALAETLLARRWHPDDGLLRASAALAADLPWEARATLVRIASGRRGVSWAAPALELARRLPDEVAGDLPARLARLAGRPKPPPEAESADAITPAAEEGTERTPR